jgi:hypothetical protein
MQGRFNMNDILKERRPAADRGKHYRELQFLRRRQH